MERTREQAEAYMGRPNRVSSGGDVEGSDHSSSPRSSRRSSTKLTTITITEPAIPRKKSGTTAFSTKRTTRSITSLLYPELVLHPEVLSGRPLAVLHFRRDVGVTSAGVGMGHTFRPLAGGVLPDSGADPRVANPLVLVCSCSFTVRAFGGAGRVRASDA